MKVIILTGGVGKRMAPIKKDKCLIKFLGKELILHQIEKLHNVGLKDIIIIGNPTNINTLKKLCGDNIEYVVQEKPKGMADALLSIKNIPEQVLIVSANDVFDEEAYKNVIDTKGDSVILGYEVKEYFPGGYLIVKGDKMQGIIEKPGAGNEPSNLVNIVVHIHRKFPELVRCMKAAKTDKDDQYEVAMDDMIKEDYDYRVSKYNGFWGSIKFPWHIFEIRNYFLDKAEARISTKASIAKSAEIIGKVIIEDGVKVFENAVIKGPCYIGKNSIIGNNVFMWNYTHVGEGCVMGFSSELKYSYVGDNTNTHQSFVGDSIIMDNCNIAAGTITANYRFDTKTVKIKVGDNLIDTGRNHFGCIIGSNVKTGVNVSIMPGIRIGVNTIIGPDVVVDKDIPKDKYFIIRQETEIRDNEI
ncbi:NTP transferase domain-containing protein [Candidatus Woesearchaeota archaeon]|jgi:UDP-N-acetylglucosamine diphosphorylase / glucose-1-phosphate thymidylyltransferase / UDP-N-acetylgalactosamine diphosphorylase / glucosamine-1-phosphate N-acetyltransferase / galactosamine-1-phosphate N-acetyltransferase|nr:NTP transferase domain-containing protein [Candidatus Woesearchaeota archaeon]MBT7062780.1 NTP transferase domain-containing protein [Candidatus Woesearchaeota archaeon]MBT7402424.1 NTP transferase domain-containing protein [Candidatus Woesearchaeota archaeon]